MSKTAGDTLTTGVKDILKQIVSLTASIPELAKTRAGKEDPNIHLRSLLVVFKDMAEAFLASETATQDALTAAAIDVDMLREEIETVRAESDEISQRGLKGNLILSSRDLQNKPSLI